MSRSLFFQFFRGLQQVLSENLEADGGNLRQDVFYRNTLLSVDSEQKLYYNKTCTSFCMCFRYYFVKRR